MKLGRELKGFPTAAQVYEQLSNVDERFGSKITDGNSVDGYKSSVFVFNKTKLEWARSVCPAIEGALEAAEMAVLWKTEPHRRARGATAALLETLDIPFATQVVKGDAPTEMWVGPFTTPFTPRRVMELAGVGTSPGEVSQLKRNIGDALRETVRQIPDFGEKLKEVRNILSSAGMQREIRRVSANAPFLKSGRYVRVNIDQPDVPGFTWDGPVDYLDLKTENWAEISPDSFFPTED